MTHKKLLDLLFALSFKHTDKPVFTLSSGRESACYIECQMALNTGRGMELVGQRVYQLIEPLGADAIGGLMSGADAIAYPTAMTAHNKGKNLNVFRVRKTPKEHGMGKTIEGPVKRGDRVVIVDDVVTTGDSTLKAIKAAQEAGLTILKVIILVDRRAGGKEKIEDTGISTEAIFTIDDFSKLQHEKQTENKRTPKERVISR